jgi:hypothetical protein
MRRPVARRLVGLGLLSLAVIGTAATVAEAQGRRARQGEVLIFRVKPRSFLDPGTVVPVGSLNRTTSGYAQTQLFILSPPYEPSIARYGQDVLPDPITNGPFVGARNPFGPIDFVAPPGLGLRR